MFEPPQKPLSRSERWTLVVLAAIFIGLLLADIVTDFTPVKLSIVFVLLAWAPLLLLHEFGHALTAHALGWRVDAIVIGYGRTVARYRYRHIPIEIRLLPVEGFVRVAPGDLVRPQLKSALIYFAGPGIELTLALVILWLAGPATLLVLTDHVGVIAVQSLAVAAVLGAVLNLLPHSTVTANGTIVSDGLGILISLLAPREAFERQLDRPSS